MNEAAPQQPAAPVSDAEADELFSQLSSEDRLLVAVSGGPDSIALLGLLNDWARRGGYPLPYVATVDHGLRPEAADEAAAVAEFSRGLGLSHATLRWQGDKPQTGIQASARRARYSLLKDESDRLGGAALVTAHTRDDQAETVLMRMAHGSGPRGLGGMRPTETRPGLKLYRPLLPIAKARLVATAEARSWPFVVDPSNCDDRFERVRWRALLPRLAEEGLTAARLSALAVRLGRMDQALDHRVQALLPTLLSPRGKALQIDFCALAEEPNEIVLRVLAAALAQLAADSAELRRLARLEACVAALIEAWRARRREVRTLAGCRLMLAPDGRLTITREEERRRGVHPAAP